MLVLTILELGSSGAAEGGPRWAWPTLAHPKLNVRGFCVRFATVYANTAKGAIYMYKPFWRGFNWQVPKSKPRSNFSYQPHAKEDRYQELHGLYLNTRGCLGSSPFVLVFFDIPPRADVNMNTSITIKQLPNWNL